MKSNLRFLRATLVLSSLLAMASSALAQIDIGTSDASDGDVGTGGGDFYFNMAQATTGTWDQVSPVPGKGVYDPVKWAVVYKFNNINCNSMNFTPHPSGCPVVVLVQGNCSIAGFGLDIRVGGFPGGPGFGGASIGGAGLGLGGGQATNDISRYGGGGSYGTLGGSHGAISAGDIYGNPSIIPLVGGSGGGSYFSSTGGRGGAAILVACRNDLSIRGGTFTNGESTGGSGGGAGSGGSIRFISNNLTGNGGGNLQAVGGTSGVTPGGVGRIRLEANTFGAWGTSFPAPSLATVGTTAKIWPENTDPSVLVVSVNNVSAPLDPGVPFNTPDVQLSTQGTLAVKLECRNVPTDGSWTVTVRGAPRSGQATVYPCTLFSGNQALSVWTTNVPFTEGLQVIHGRAKKTVINRPGKPGK
ncbi:MAG: hypothetical protein K8R88_07410 [Armatimonadetes bacterium]|nr:hypothetical protein [Armatimonadota bacterium]